MASSLPGGTGTKNEGLIGKGVAAGAASVADGLLWGLGPSIVGVGVSVDVVVSVNEEVHSVVEEDWVAVSLVADIVCDSV